LPLHIASLAIHHVEIRFSQSYGDGACVAGGIDWQIAIFDAISVSNVIRVPILLCVSFILIPVTKL